MSTILWSQLSTFTKILAPWTTSSTGQCHTGVQITIFSYQGLVLFLQEGFWLLSSLREDCEGEGASRGREAEGVHQKIWPGQQASGTRQTQTGGLVCQPLRNSGNSVCSITSNIRKPLKAYCSISEVQTSFYGTPRPSPSQNPQNGK